MRKRREGRMEQVRKEEAGKVWKRREGRRDHALEGRRWKER